MGKISPAFPAVWNGPADDKCEFVCLSLSCPPPCLLAIGGRSSIGSFGFIGLDVVCYVISH